MLRLPSVQHEYDDYFSGDSAFVQPPPHPGDKASEKEIADHAEKVVEHHEKIKRARQTGDWSELLIDGETPTKFVMRAPTSKQWRYIMDESIREDRHKMGFQLAMHYMFRCACRGVRNLGAQLPERLAKDSDHPALGPIALPDVTDFLDKIEESIVLELGSVALDRAKSLDPL